MSWKDIIRGVLNPTLAFYTLLFSTLITSTISPEIFHF